MQAQYISYLIILMITITIIGLLITGFANTWQEWEQTQHYYQIINNIQRICDLFDAAIAENKSKVAYINMPETMTIGFSPVQASVYVNLNSGDTYLAGAIIGSFYFKTGIRILDVGTRWLERGKWSFFTYAFPKSLLNACTEYDGSCFSMFLSLGIDVDMPNSTSLIIHIKFPVLMFSLTEESKSIKSFRLTISVKQYTSYLDGETVFGPTDVVLKLISNKLNVTQMTYLTHIPEGEFLSIRFIYTCIVLEVEFD